MLDNGSKQMVEANLKLSASNDEDTAFSYQRKIAKALELPLREEVKDGLLVGQFFETVDATGVMGTNMPFPLALMDANDVNNYEAYAIPDCGFIPYNIVEHGELRVPFYEIGNGLDICIKFIEEGRWDIVADMYNTIRVGFQQKMNRDGIRTILTAAEARDIVVQDSAASAGEFTKKLISDMALRMVREGGGNTASNERFKLTDLLVSPEALSQMYNWDETQLDHFTRREMNSKEAYEGVGIFGVRVRPLDGLGVSREYQDYIIDTLGRALTGSDTEFVVGMDLSKKNKGLVMPLKRPLELFEDRTVHRKRQWGIYGWMTVGFAQLDSRLSMLGSF